MKAQTVFRTSFTISVVLLLVYFRSSIFIRSWETNQQLSGDAAPALRPELKTVTTEVPKLTPQELQGVEICVQTAPSVRATAHGQFWAPGVEMVRVTSHKYLNTNSLVFDVGGNVGFDDAEFLQRYSPYMVILEPLPSLYNRLVHRFGQDPRVRLINIGLGKKDMDVHVEVKGHDGDATSIHTGKNVTGGEVAKIRKTIDVMKELQLINKPIDLLHINCEGCEYDVLETVVQSSLVHQMRHIQWASHVEYAAVGDFYSRYCHIIELLKRTHRPMYRFAIVWECWELKELPGS